MWHLQQAAESKLRTLNSKKDGQTKAEKLKRVITLSAATVIANLKFINATTFSFSLETQTLRKF